MKVFLCQYCNFYDCDNKSLLIKHENNCWNNCNAINPNKTNWYCKICNERFKTGREKQSHDKMMHSKVRNQQCSYCLKEWNTTDKFHFTHESKCPQNIKAIYYKCNYCGIRKNNQKIKNTHEFECFHNPINQCLKNINFSRIYTNSINNIGIYKITTVSGKIYIGMTCDSFKARWSEHYKKLRIKKHHCRGLQNSFNKYGINGLKFEILEEYSSNNVNMEKLRYFLLQREKYIWNEQKMLGNLLLNGEPSGKGSVKHSRETIDKISNSAMLNGKYCNIYFLNCSNEKCDKLFSSKNKNKKYCSLECKNEISVNVSRLNKILSYSICNNSLCCNYCLNEYCSIDCKNNPERLLISEIEFLYNRKNFTVRQIAKELGLTHTTIINRMKMFNIVTRSKDDFLKVKKSNQIKNKFVQEKLYNLYIKDKISMQKISELYGVDRRLVSEALDFYGIKRT